MWEPVELRVSTENCTLGCLWCLSGLVEGLISSGEFVNCRSDEAGCSPGTGAIFFALTSHPTFKVDGVSVTRSLGRGLSHMRTIAGNAPYVRLVRKSHAQ